MPRGHLGALPHPGPSPPVPSAAAIGVTARAPPALRGALRGCLWVPTGPQEPGSLAAGHSVASPGLVPARPPALGPSPGTLAACGGRRAVWSGETARLCGLCAPGPWGQLSPGALHADRRNGVWRAPAVCGQAGVSVGGGSSPSERILHSDHGGGILLLRNISLHTFQGF